MTEEDCGNPAGIAERGRLPAFRRLAFCFAEVQRCVFNTFESCGLESLRNLSTVRGKSFNLENLSSIPKARAPALCIGLA